MPPAAGCDDVGGGEGCLQLGDDDEHLTWLPPLVKASRKCTALASPTEIAWGRTFLWLLHLAALPPWRGRRRPLEPETHGPLYREGLG